MKILVLSDIHLEFGTFEPPSQLDFDVVVLAGDIHSPGHKAVAWARRESVFGTTKPILLVPGNHEFYGQAWQTELQSMFEAADGTNVHVMHQREVILSDPARPDTTVRFFGSTLWTDFQMPVLVEYQGRGVETTDVARALEVANRHLNDFRRIDMVFADTAARAGVEQRQRRRPLRAEDTLAWHWIDRDWLRRKLAEPFDGPTVVVTHHAPARQSVHAEYADDWLTPAFVSELPRSFFDVPRLWVHGHTHTSFNYRLGECLVVSNPRGYKLDRSGAGYENSGFRADCVIEI